MRDDAALAVRDQAAQRYRKIGTDIAAEAAVAEERNIVARAAQQRIVDAGFAEFVDDDRRAGALRTPEKMAHQRGLSGAEEPSHHRDRHPGAAFAFEPAPERAGGRGGDERKPDAPVARMERSVIRDKPRQMPDLPRMSLRSIRAT